MGKFIFIGIGILMTLGGGFMTKNSLELKSQGLTTTGTVIDIKQTRNSDNEIMYKKVIEFTDSKNEVRTFTPSSSTSWKPTVGKQTPLLYVYKENENLTIKENTFMGIWFLPTLLSCMGILFVVAGIYGKPVRKRSKYQSITGVAGLLLDLKKNGLPEHSNTGSGSQIPEAMLEEVKSLYRQKQTPEPLIARIEKQLRNSLQNKSPQQSQEYLQTMIDKLKEMPSL